MTQTQYRVRGTLAGASLLVLSSPTLALAEEENTGMKLLIPNMAEFVPACVAFIIIFVIMSKFAWPAILKMMEDREKKIQGDLDSAEQSKNDAAVLSQDAKAKVAQAEREATEIVAQAKRDAEGERTRIIAEAQTSAQNIIAKAHDAVAAERKKAMIELSGQVVDLSVEIATKIIGDALDADEQRELAERYLVEVGSLNDE